MNIVNLMESVDFHPSVMSVKDGHTYIEYPPAGTTEVSKPCQECEYYGEHVQNYDPSKCLYCHGTQMETDTIYNFPNLNVSGFNVQTITDMLGLEYEDHGWIDNKDLPAVMRTLLRLKNGDVSSFTSEPTSERNTCVDTSGDIPTISSGATMMGGGRSTP